MAKIKQILLIILVIITITSNAAHLVGGVMTYKHISGDNYEVTLTVYRDCNSAGAPFDIQAPIGIYNAAGNLIRTELPSYTGSTNVPIVLNNPCLVTSTNVCIEKADYVFSTNLPPIAGGYNIVYQRCCRNSLASNILSPGNMGNTYQVHIPDPSLATNNSSPTFDNTPPITMCSGEQFVYDLSATDPDGDQLEYVFSTPYTGGTTANPAPNPPAPPPFTPIAWSGGFSVNNQLNTTPIPSLDINTGQLDVTPTTAGIFVFCVTVNEYRNGVLIGSVTRDLLMVVQNCQLTTVAAHQTQTTNLCTGLTYNFQDLSSNATGYSWDFGVPGISTDISSQQNPTYTFPTEGSYEVTLIANPNTSCADTTQDTIHIYNSIQIQFTPPADQCLTNNSFDFSVSGTYSNTAIFDWDFGASANPPTSNTETTNNVQFATAGIHPVSIKVKQNVCEEVIDSQIEVFAAPITLFDVDTFQGCNPHEFIFDNQSTVTGTKDFLWDFGDGNSSTDEHPKHQYATAGNYTVTLISNPSLNCATNYSLNVSVYDEVKVNFLTPASQCLNGNSFALNATGTYTSAATFTWDFGASATPPTSTITSPIVSYPDSGSFPISLIVNENICSDTAWGILDVFLEPTVNFGIDTNQQCIPYTFTFSDSTITTTPLIYLWDFGDGSISNLQNPTHAYTTSGTYDVTLTVTSSSGCLTTETLKIPTMVTAHHTPTAEFIYTPNEPTIFDPKVTIQDVSGAFQSEFNILSNDFTTVLRNFTRDLVTPGDHPVQQIVTSSIGCADTLIQIIHINDDFLPYIPNTFTVDGDNLNNTFTPIINGVTEYEFSVFNRWGKRLFHTNEKGEGWDGRYKEKPCKQDVYVWKIKVKTKEKNIQEQLFGKVLLLR